MGSCASMLAAISLDDITSSRRLRENLADLYLSNQVAADRVQSLAADGHAAGAQGMDLRTAGKGGLIPGNTARDLRRKLSKSSKWQTNYYAPIRVFDVKKQTIVRRLVAFALPHEIMHVLVFYNGHAPFLSTAGMCNKTLSSFQALKTELRIADLCGLGLWGDGIPMNWDRSQSVDTWTMNIPGLVSGDGGNARFPICALNHKHVAKEVTNDDILSIVSWSMRCLLEGQMPISRHDGARWLPSDRWRRKLQGTPIGGEGPGFRAALTEVRGDWKHYKDVFRLPGHNSKDGCCWLCSCTPATIRAVFADAVWRVQRSSHWDNLAKWLTKGQEVSPILSCPGFKTYMFLLDWLHVMDIGVASDFQANVFLLVISKLPQPTAAARCAALFRMLQQFYRDHPVDSCLDNLTLSMLSNAKKGVKLRARGGECRNLVPFTLQIALDHLSDEVPIEAAAKQATVQLSALYQNLSRSLFNAEHMKKHSRLFALQYVALEAFTLAQNPLSKAWRIKPKLHLMQELAEHAFSNPSDVWCYRDEDFGGTISALARSRGGSSSVLACSRTVLQSFYARHPVPVFS